MHMIRHRMALKQFDAFLLAQIPQNRTNLLPRPEAVVS